jgi:hypothetical protein
MAIASAPPIGIPPPPTSVSGGAVPPSKKAGDIVVIPEKFYAAALKMKAAEWVEEKPAPAPPPPPKPVAPVVVREASSSRLPWIILGVVLVLLLVGGGYVYFNRDLLFPKPVATPPAPPAPLPVQAPSAPGNLTAAAVSQSVRLTWLDIAGNEDGFRVERKEGEGTFLPLTNLAPNSTAFLDTSAQPGKGYVYRVTALNAGGESAPSNEAPVSIAALAPAPTPSPSLPPGGLDSDSDGLSDVEEQVFNTDPSNPDTDRDSFLDGNEAFHLYNPAAKAPVRLLDSGLVKAFTAPAGWTLYVPAAWTPTLDRPDGSKATLQTGRDELFTLALEDNAQELSAAEWYLAKHPGVTAADLRDFTTKGGLQGVLSPDRLEAVFRWDGQVFVIRYDLHGQSFVNFRTIFGMMLNSLKLEGAPQVKVVEDASQGSSALFGIAPTGTETNTTQAPAVTSSEPTATSTP